MRIPLEISFHGLDRSESVENQVRQDVAKLERICDHLVSCRVGIKLDQKSSATGNPFRIRIEMRVPPGHNLVVTNTSGNKEAADDLRAVLKNTFRSAQRRLKQLVEKQQGEKKQHPEQEVSAIVQKVFADEGYGFLRTLDGEEIYFHRNAVSQDRFAELEPGTGVSYTAVAGEQGSQATTVQIIQKAMSGQEGGEAGEDDISPLGWRRRKR